MFILKYFICLQKIGMAAARREWRGRARAEASDRRAATAGDVRVIGLALFTVVPFPPSRASLSAQACASVFRPLAPSQARRKSRQALGRTHQ